ncbi:MAG: hypothetical protein HY721_06510 [Planctomycetes bacterium]|nr:hypothetical protein [Planctomycetota bacterium]
MKQVSDPNTPIGEVLKAAGTGGVLVESGSKVRYAVLPLDDDLLDFLLEHNPRFIAECAEIRARMRNGRFKTHDEVRRLLGRPRGGKGK